jgi:hypothetical protein
MEQQRPRVDGLFSRMMIRAAAVAFFTAFPLCSSSTGTEYECGNAPVFIQSQASDVNQDICDAAEEVVKFFGRLDLQFRQPLVIEVVRNLPQELGGNAVGCYREEDNKVYVVTYSAFQDRESWFGLPLTKSTYRGLVAHEVAHAIASCNFAMPEPTVHAHEFIAYVTMLATMDSESRSQVLALRPAVVFDEESEFNELTYSFDPILFGIAAYRYYSKEEHGDVFLLKVLSGNALTNSVFDLP